MYTSSLFLYRKEYKFNRYLVNVVADYDKKIISMWSKAFTIIELPIKLYDDFEGNMEQFVITYVKSEKNIDLENYRDSKKEENK